MAVFWIKQLVYGLQFTVGWRKQPYAVNRKPLFFGYVSGTNRIYLNIFAGTFWVQIGYFDMENKLSFDFGITQQIITKLGLLDTFKGQWQALEKKENRYLQELRHIATIESIGSSTRIEGATLPDNEIDKLLNKVKITKLTRRDEQEVVGYYEALDVVLDNYSNFTLTENNIKHLHKILLRHSDKDKHHLGNYKILSNKVVANYSKGVQKVIFNTTDPHLVQKEMQELLQWANESFENNKVHPLLVIAAFVYEFLSIHPFQDGNGRLSRLITTLLLLQTGYHFVQYMSFEHLIENKKKNYYAALMSGQKNRYTKKEKIHEWILFFLESMIELTSKLETKYKVYQSKGGYLNDRQKKILSIVKKIQPAGLTGITSQIPKLSRNTLKKDLLYLLHQHLLEKVGRGRATMYILKN